MLTGQSQHRLPGRVATRPLAGSYPSAVAIALLALSPFIVLSTATQLLQTELMSDLAASVFGVELAGALANAGYAFGAVLAADLIRRVPTRWLYVGCEFAFAAGSVVCATSNGLTQFVFGRTLQGLATGMLLVAALPPLVTRFGVERLPLTAAFVNLGLFGMVTLGPLVGGVTATALAWRWLFAGTAVLALIGAGLGVLGFDAGDDAAPRAGFDWSAVPVAAAATVLPFTAVAWIARSGFTSPVFLTMLVVGALFLGLLLLRQYRKSEPLMPLKLISHTMPLTGLGIAMLAGAAVTALVELSVLYLTKVAGATPLVCGSVLATQVLGVIVAAWLFKRFLPTRWLPAYAFVGLGVVALGSGVLLLLSPDDAVIVTAIAGLLLGFGAGAGVAPALFMAGLSAPSNRLGPTFALVELLRAEAAFLVAPVVAQAAPLAASLADGVRLGALSLLGLCLAGGAVLLVLLLLGGVRPHAPDLPRWIGGEEPAYNSPRVAAAVRSDGGEHRLA
ncbi:MAG TPA: MFS transporter [Jatrophihabitantaceae bacterium]|nr:MFS transporter [Jatrophihabitantaceae bacterium]